MNLHAKQRYQQHNRTQRKRPRPSQQPEQAKRCGNKECGKDQVDRAELAVHNTENADSCQHQHVERDTGEAGQRQQFAGSGCEVAATAAAGPSPGSPSLAEPLLVSSLIASSDTPANPAADRP